MGEKLDNAKVRLMLEEETEKAREILHNREALLGMLVKAEEKIRSAEALSSIQDLPVMVHIVRSYAYGTASNVSEDSAAVMAGALLYLTKEDDFFQDDTPVIGLFDDMAVIWAAIDKVKEDIRTFGK